MESPRVLVVDDNGDSRLLLAELLTLKGFEVQAVASGREALRTIEQARPDAVLLDLQMPDMDGFTTLAAIRELSPSLPVIAVSGHVLPDDERRIRAAGFDASMGKPIELPRLVDIVRTLVQRTRGEVGPR